MSTDSDQPPEFFEQFDDEFPVGPEEGNGAFVGTNVLRGLIEGIDDFSKGRQKRWGQYHSMGPVLLGSAMWIDDAELIARLADLTAASVVVTKQGRGPNAAQKLAQLQAANDRTRGLPIRAFPALGGLAAKVNGLPAVVGPYEPIDELVIPTIRTLGYRKHGGALVPIAHAKLALLGNMFWYDEGPMGSTGDFAGFTPRRLWVSSANFTKASRRSIEFGFWTEEPKLLQGAERFLLKLIEASEDLDPDADLPAPEYSQVEFDDDAFAEVVAEMNWGSDATEDETYED